MLCTLCLMHSKNTLSNLEQKLIIICHQALWTNLDRKVITSPCCSSHFFHTSRLKDNIGEVTEITIISTCVAAASRWSLQCKKMVETVKDLHEINILSIIHTSLQDNYEYFPPVGCLFLCWQEWSERFKVRYHFTEVPLSTKSTFKYITEIISVFE